MLSLPIWKRCKFQTKQVNKSLDQLLSQLVITTLAKNSRSIFCFSFFFSGSFFFDWLNLYAKKVAEAPRYIKYRGSWLQTLKIKGLLLHPQYHFWCSKNWLYDLWVDNYFSVRKHWFHSTISWVRKKCYNDFIVI